MLPHRLAPAALVAVTLLFVGQPIPLSADPQEHELDLRYVKFLHRGNLAVEDGVYSLRLSLWISSQYGPQIWEEYTRDVPVTGGSYEVTLDTMLPRDLEDRDVWVEVETLAGIVDKHVALKSHGPPLSIHSHGVTMKSNGRMSDIDEFGVHLANSSTTMNYNIGWVLRRGGSIGFYTSPELLGLAIERFNIGSTRVVFYEPASLLDGTDVALTPKDSGWLVIGPGSATNLGIDNNEIQVRNNGTVADLLLQNEGGNVRINGNVVQASDARYKKNVVPLIAGLPEVLQLRPVSYEWADREDQRHLGLIAQDVQPVVPEVVSEDEEGKLGIAYSDLIPVLVGAIQEQQEVIEELRSRQASLREQVDILLEARESER